MRGEIIPARLFDDATCSITFLAFLSNSIISNYTTSTSTFITFPRLASKLCSSALASFANNSFIHFHLLKHMVMALNESYSFNSINSIHKFNFNICLIICAFSVIPSKILRLVALIKVKVFIKFIENLFCVIFFIMPFVVLYILPKFLRSIFIIFPCFFTLRKWLCSFVSLIHSFILIIAIHR
jgi:hypothetical protein